MVAKGLPGALGNGGSKEEEGKSMRGRKRWEIRLKKQFFSAALDLPLWFQGVMVSAGYHDSAKPPANLIPFLISPPTRGFFFFCSTLLIHL